MVLDHRGFKSLPLRNIIMNEYRQLTRSDFIHNISIDTRWGDMDALRHLNHAKYLTYMENARVDFYASLGFGELRHDQNPSMILGGMTIDYITQVAHPASLIVCHRINKVGKKSFDYLGAIFAQHNEHPVCTGLFSMISFDYNQQKTVEVPQVIRDNLYQQ